MLKYQDIMLVKDRTPTWRLRIGLLIIMSLLLCHTSWAEPFRHSATDILFPDIVAGLERQQKVTDYESSKPGYGISVGYDGPGIIVTIYIYTLGMPEVPPDVNNSITAFSACGTRSIAGLTSI